MKNVSKDKEETYEKQSQNKRSELSALPCDDAVTRAGHEFIGAGGCRNVEFKPNLQQQ